MKHIVSGLLFCSLVSGACRKNDEVVIENPGKRYDVTFDVSEFRELKGASTLADDTLFNLKCYVFDNNGNRVYDALKEQPASGATSSDIKLQLPAGNYSAVFFSAKGFTAIYDNDQINSSYIWPDTKHDLYYKRVPITVSDQSVSESVQLDRINSAIEIKLLDNVIPPDRKVLVNYRDYRYINFDSSVWTIKSLTYEKTLTAADASKTLTFIPKVFNTSESVRLTIATADLEGNILSSRQVDVRCYKNRKTVLSGHLFSAPATTTASVNTEWQTGTTTNF